MAASYIPTQKSSQEPPKVRKKGTKVHDQVLQGNSKEPLVFVSSYVIFANKSFLILVIHVFSNFKIISVMRFLILNQIAYIEEGEQGPTLLNYNQRDLMELTFAITTFNQALVSYWRFSSWNNPFKFVNQFQTPFGFIPGFLSRLGISKHNSPVGHFMSW